MSIDDLVREFSEYIVDKLSSIPSDTERFMLFIAWLNTSLKRYGCRLIVVGGFAVEIYTGSVYRTLDIDLIVEGRNCIDILKKFLAIVADRGLRVYIPRFRSLAMKGIDIVGTVYNKKKNPILIEMVIDNRTLYFWIEPPEELIVRYLAAWKYWNSSEDRDKVFALLSTLWNKLDRDYLEKRVREEGVEDKFREALEVLSLG